MLSLQIETKKQRRRSKLWLNVFTRYENVAFKDFYVCDNGGMNQQQSLKSSQQRSVSVCFLLKGCSSVCAHGRVLQCELSYEAHQSSKVPV